MLDRDAHMENNCTSSGEQLLASESTHTTVCIILKEKRTQVHKIEA